MAEPRLQRQGSPTGLQRWLFRAPIGLYRVKFGFIFGNRFLMLEHVGRKSGRARRVVLEVVSNQADVAYVAAAWGSKAQWLRNLEANPRVTFYLGSRRYAGDAVIVDRTEAENVMATYAAAHPRALAKLASFMLDDPGDTNDERARRVAEAIPMVRLPKTR